MSGHGRTGVWIGIVLLFLAMRVALLVTRDPFFDELLTVWYSEKPIARHWSLLAGDSGSPLYTAVARCVHVIAGFSVASGRLLSLAFGLGALAICASFREPGDGGWMAGLALAAFPPHIFFSTEARAYALAALLLGAASVLLYRWTQTARPGFLAGAVATLVLAAYTHSYGVLFFPLPFVLSLLTRDRRLILHGFAASAATGVLFLPGFFLASVQPLTSIEWMGQSTLAARLQLVVGSFLQLGFAASYQPVLLATLSLVLRAISFLIVAAIVVAGLRRSPTARFFAIFIVVPLAAVFAFAAAGKTFYFPTRFESTLSVPFALLLASSLLVIPRRAAVAALAMLVTLGGIVTIRSAADHAYARLTPYRAAALFLTQPGRPDLQVIASGYTYLEVISAIGENGVGAYPSEQALHPGWVDRADPLTLSTELPRLPARFIWVGVEGTAEAKALAGRFRLSPIFRQGAVVAAVAEEKA